MECLEERPHGGDRLAGPRRVLVVAGLGEERPVCRRPVLADICEPFSQQLERLGDPVIVCDGTAGGCFSGRFRTITEVEEAEDQVVGVLVRVAVLEGEGLEDGVRQHVRDPDADLRGASAVEAHSLEIALDEVVAHEVGPPDVERTDHGACRARFRSEDETGRHRFRLAEELDDDLGALDLACPPKAWLLLVEVRLLQVVLERPVRLRRLVTEREADDEVDVGRSHVSAHPFRQLSDEIPGREATDEVDALAPGPEIAQQRDERALATRWWRLRRSR